METEVTPTLDRNMTDAQEMCETTKLELHNLVLSDTDEGQTEENHCFSEEVASDEIPQSFFSYIEASKSRAAAYEKFLLEEYEDEAGADEYTQHDQHLALDMSTLEMSLNEEERKNPNRYEQRRQREKDFQEELKKINEAKELRQKEIELVGKRAQEKHEQEWLIQQERISNLKSRVAEERKIIEEEQKRMKKEMEEKERSMREEENRRKREEVEKKREAERNRLEEEMRVKEEAEKRKIAEMRLKEEEEQRKKQEEDRKKREEEEKRRQEKEENKRKEERQRLELEKKKLEDEMREAEEERNERMTKKEDEEGRKVVEVAGKSFEEDKKMEEEWREKEMEEQKRKEEKQVKVKEEDIIVKEVEDREKQEEAKKEKKEEEGYDRKNTAEERMIYEEMEKCEKEHGDNDVKIKLERTKRSEEERKTMEEERKSEKKINMMEEEKKEMEEVEKMENDRKLEEEKRTKKEEENRKNERNTQKEGRMRQEEEMRRQREEGDDSKTQEEIRPKEEKDRNKECEAGDRKMEPERKNKCEEKKQEDVGVRKMGDGRKNREEEEVQVHKEGRENKGENLKMEEGRLKEEDKSTKIIMQGKEKALKGVNERQEKKRENKSGKTQNETENTDDTGKSQTSQLQDSSTQTFPRPGPLHSDSTVSPTITTTVQHHDQNNGISQSSVCNTVGPKDPVVRPSTPSASCLLPEHTEQQRLLWMRDCIPWSKLSLQNRRKQRGSAVQSQRGPRRVTQASGLPPLCPDTLLQSTGCKSLQEVTTATLEDLRGCSLSTLGQCRHLRSLTLRRCGLKALEGVNQLPELCYIDVQENDISFVDCENMANLRVLRLGHNALMSIHGLSGADNLDFLDLSHNSITRIAGLQSMRRLQRLSLDHNQLISTKGLREVYTLLHLDCSHNHLVSVEGLENSALLSTLDLTANSLAEPPCLNNQVLLTELRLDDNSISSLQGLAACWLPLMQILSVAQNRITHLHSMSNFVSLANLDLGLNCLSELKNVCESLEGCQFLKEVHLMGNPLEQESGWRSTMHKAVRGLRAADGQETDSSLSPPAVKQVSLASGSFLAFCQAQLQQTRDLQRRHSEEISNASLPLDFVKTSCRHFAEALQLAEDQRFSHEYGDTTAADKQRSAGTTSTTPEEMLDAHRSSAGKVNECSGMEFTGKVSPLILGEDDIRGSYWTPEEALAIETQQDPLDTVRVGPIMTSAVSKANYGSFHSSATKGKMTTAIFKKAAASSHEDLDIKSTAAVVIQQQWRNYRQKCGNISSPPTPEKRRGKGGDGGKPESGPSYIKWNIVGQDHAATVIQAFWRGFTLRRRLTSALAAVTCPNTGEDETFEEVDMDEFVFDEAALETEWTSLLCEDSPPRCSPVPEQPPCQKPPGPIPEPSQSILPVWRSKQAWVARDQMDPAGQRVSPESLESNKSPASASMLSGLSERSEKILEEWGFTDSRTALLMLKRAQKMKSKKQQQKKHLDPSARPALFRNRTYQPGPMEARNRPAPRNRNYIKVREAELGLQRADEMEQVKWEKVQEWLHDQSDIDSESERFLPQINSDVLNGGRVQLVAEPGYTEHLHHASGLWANSSFAAQPCKENNYPRRNSLGHAKKEVPAPERVTSDPSKKERISMRDNPVQLSGGWGGGKKRHKVHK